MEPRIDARDLFLRLGDDELLVIDCRSEEEWESQPLHIPGAMRMTYAELCEAAHILPDDELIVLCGAHADDEDAHQAWRVLRLRGRPAVCLHGGLAAWMEQGYPVERHVPGERRQRVQAVGLA